MTQRMPRRALPTLSAAQIGCVIGALAYVLHDHASDDGRAILIAVGRWTCDTVGAVLTWDQHRRLHDPIAVWGPLVLLACAIGLAALPAARRIPDRFQALFQLLGPWFVLSIGAEVVGRPAVWLIAAGATAVWALDRDLEGLRRSTLAILLSIPAYAWMLGQLSIWIAPLGWLSFLLCLAHLIGRLSGPRNEGQGWAAGVSGGPLGRP